MESLNASTLSVILKIREGTGFGFLSAPFIIVCSLNGNGLTSDPIPFSPNPTFESDFVWEADKKVLRSMRSHNYSIRVECFSDAKFRRSDKIGYILLNMKHQAQIISPTLGTNVKFQWHKLLGVRNDAKSYKPEIYLSLFIAEADPDTQVKSPKAPQPGLPPSVKTEEVTSKEKEGQQEATVAIPMDNSVAKKPVQIGSPRENDVPFKLTIKVSSVHNLISVIEEKDSIEDLYLEFALFGDCFRTSDLSKRDGELDECITLLIKSQIHSLVAYFTEFPSLRFLLRASGQTAAEVSFDISGFLSKEKCDNLSSGKVSCLQHESKLILNGSTSDSECYFVASISLQIDKSKVKNPIKPFTVSTNNKRVEKNEVNKIRGVSCKTKMNAATPREEIIPPTKDTPKSRPSSQEDTNKLANNMVPEVTKISDKTEECQNNFKDGLNNWCNQQPPHPNFNMNPQCYPSQFAYPYFQPNFPFLQDGRGDAHDIFAQQKAPDLTEKVKAKITEELARKTCEELEEWKEKQKESYKTELKKKLDKEVKRLTAEWLSRQNELEREATTNIEESVSLSHQLHSTSAELKVRLESVTRQQMELEKEREELDKKYADKYNELREASKKHQTNLQQQISSLTSELEELKARTCSLLKENEMLRSLSHLGGDGEAGTGSSQHGKSSHLTEQQMTSLLVDMKSLEEKLSAAQESKEFFRKEWSRALREIHRMKTEQEEQVRLQLQAQRQELDNLRLVGMITADEKASKDDLASLRDLRNQIVRLNTPKSG